MATNPAASPDLSSIRVANAAAIDDFFQNRKNQHYVKWFNSSIAGKGPWAQVSLVDTPSNDTGFHEFWDQIPLLFGGADASIVQFISLMSILSNEVRGNFTPQSERMGRTGHPGMAYLFDAIEGLKRSYNTLPGNKTAFECFNDAGYIAAHGSAALGSLAKTTDARWSGAAWPAGIDTNPDPAVTGFIIEADFMKFRGRGFIQTTGRANYLPLISFTQSYPAGNATIDAIKAKWAGQTPDQVAFSSTNDDWDRLFQQTDLIIAAEAVRVHNVRSGNYLALSADPAVLNGTGPGSIYNMGLRISGGVAYANLFKQRVTAVLAAV